MVERLNRDIRAVRIRRWRTNREKELLYQERENDMFDSEISYDDINIGDIKRRDANNVDGFNQKTLTQIFAPDIQVISSVDVIAGGTEDKASELQDDATDNDSDGTLFLDYSIGEGVCKRYDNGTGPLWKAQKWSPYVNHDLDELCEMWDNEDGI